MGTVQMNTVTNEIEQAERWQVWATVYYVVGTRGRLRCILLVRCRCGYMHQHTAKADFVNGWRRAACGGRYLVHAVTVEGAAA